MARNLTGRREVAGLLSEFYTVWVLMRLWNLPAYEMQVFCISGVLIVHMTYLNAFGTKQSVRNIIYRWLLVRGVHRAGFLPTVGVPT